MKENIGKYLIDLSKLIFGGVIVSGIMKQDINLFLLFTVGVAVSSITAIWGFVLIKK